MYVFDFPHDAALRPLALRVAHRPRAVAVAVSGGPDSMALCHMVCACAAQAAEEGQGQGQGFIVHALIVDHGLRAESAAEAAQVARWFESWPGVTPVVLSAAALLAGQAGRIMETARAARYNVLRAYCRTHGIPYLFLGHHQDDQAETVLMRLAKGSGLDGLAGMAAYTDAAMEAVPDTRGAAGTDGSEGGLEGGSEDDLEHDLAGGCGNGVRAASWDEGMAGDCASVAGGAGPLTDGAAQSGLALLRPLLTVPKAALVAYCADKDIPYVNDPTNDNPAYARNRLRQAQDILAAEGLSSKRLSVTAHRLARARTALDFYAAQALAQATVAETDESVTLSYDVLAAHPLETQMRVMGAVMGRVAPPRGSSYGPRRERLEVLVSDLFAATVRAGQGPFRKRTLGGCVVGLHATQGHIVVQRETLS